MKTEDIPCVSVRDVVGESGAGNGLLHYGDLFLLCPRIGLGFAPKRQSSGSLGEVREAAAHFKAKGYIKGIGIDGYNQTITGEVAMTVRSKVADNEHIPLVIQARRKRVKR